MASIKRKSWLAKLRPDMQPEVKDDPRGGSLLIPTPMLIDEEIRKVPRGALTTPDQIRGRLAARFGADRTCPLCTGMFINIVAGATEERTGGDVQAMTPYWRVVREDGALLDKLPPGRDRQAELLTREGHAVAASGRRKPRVQDLARVLRD